MDKQEDSCRTWLKVVLMLYIGDESRKSSGKSSGYTNSTMQIDDSPHIGNEVNNMVKQ